jgi:hypothetical protein
MGAAPVGGRVASVRGLQEPLRQLAERIEESVCAELEVSRRGLTFRTNELHEKNNPFRRIAVWSALKLQVRRRHNSLSVTMNSVRLIQDLDLEDYRCPRIRSSSALRALSIKISIKILSKMHANNLYCWGLFIGRYLKLRLQPNSFHKILIDAKS